MQCVGLEIRQLSTRPSHSSRVFTFSSFSATQTRSKHQIIERKASKQQALMATSSRAAEFGLSSQQLDELVKDSVVWANQHGLVRHTALYASTGAISSLIGAVVRGEIKVI